MDRSFLIRALSLYVPLAGCFALWSWRKPSRAEATGALLATAWNVPALLVLNIVALRVGWWQFQAQGGVFLGVPVDLWLAWAALWGTLAVLLFRSAPLWMPVAVLGLADMVAMPLCAPVVALGKHWLVGECLGLLACAIPGMLFARWTRGQLYVGRRAVMQVMCFAGLLSILVIALLVQTGGMGSLTKLRVLEGENWAQLLFIVALPGLSAVQEFVSRGQGTPLPFDPPRRLVSSGVYAYIANPMQSCTTLLLLVLALELRSAWMAVAALVSFLYAVGLAAWDEGEDLLQRHGLPFRQYRRHVRNWVPRWRPFVPRPARVYIADECGKCSQLANFLRWLQPEGLEIFAAEEHASRDLVRMTYDPQDGSEEQSGIAALGRAFEHINLGWAWLGIAIRLPGVCHLLQSIADVSGGGPMKVVRRNFASQQDERRNDNLEGNRASSPHCGSE